MMISTFARRYTEAENMKVVATGNLMLSVCIGFHYFIKVWSPAMHGHPPSTSQAGTRTADSHTEPSIP